MKKLLSILSVVILILTSTATAATSWDYGWEDGGTNFGSYTTSPAVVTTENSAEQAYAGSRSLKIIEEPRKSTPQVYVWWVDGLQNGDTIDASFWVYSENGSSEYPRGRIYAHKTLNSDFTAYAGSLGGMDEYAGTTTWEKADYSWTFDGLGITNGLVIEARIYSDSSGPGLNTIYIDDTEITVSSDTAEIMNAAGDMLPEPAVALILLPFFALLRRK